MKTAFRLTAVVALSVSSFAVSPQRVFAQNVLPPKPSPELRARLRGQILGMVPRLRLKQGTPAAADDLALPLAQLGDWNTALRLATQPRTKDSLYGWKSAQMALRGEFAPALDAALSIRDRAERANCELIIARVALDHQNPEAARKPLLAAMQSLDQQPDSAQLAYAAWLWEQSGDSASAHRVLCEKAWPRSTRENASDKQEHPHWIGWTPENRSVVLAFAAQMGEFSEIVRRTSPGADPQISAVLGAARDRTDFELLRDWLHASKTTRPEDLMTLAICALSLDLRPEALELRDEAKTKIEAVPTQSYISGNSMLSQRGFGLYLEFIFATRSGEDAEVERLMDEIGKSAPQVGSEDNLRAISLTVRILNQNTRTGPEPRYDLDDAVVNEVADQTLAMAPAEAKDQLLVLLAKIYARRRNPSYAAPIGAAAVAEVLRQARQFESNSRQQQGGQWSWNAVEIAKNLREVSPGSELPLIEALLQRLPTALRVSGAQQLYQAGFPAAARQVFDPQEASQRDATLAVLARQQTDFKKRAAFLSGRFNPAWDQFAAIQVRFESPAAPELWFELIPDDATRVRVLRAWTGAFYPHVQFKPPYVFRGSSGNYAVVGGRVVAG